jgi:hypothetical protein
MSNDDESKQKTWAAFIHLSALSGALVPFGHLIGPFVLWLLKRNDAAFLDQQGKEAINFQLSVTLYGAVATLLTFVLIGFLLLWILLFFWLIVVIVAAVKASDGVSFRYPATIRFLG